MSTNVEIKLKNTLMEGLPNEVWLMIFKYLSPSEIFRSYHSLNKRISELISTLPLNWFDLQELSRDELRIFCQFSLPKMITYIKSIRLCDDQQQLPLLRIFRQSNVMLNQFTNLESLSLDDFHCIEILDGVIDQLTELSHLTHLTMKNFQSNENMLRRIWNLPRLSHLHLEVDQNSPREFPIPNSSCFTMKEFKLVGLTISLENCVELLQRVPNLCDIQVEVNFAQSINVFPHEFPLIKSLNLRCNPFWNSLRMLLRSMKNLNELTVKISLQGSIDGSDWQRLITTCLPNLKKFRFFLSYCFPRNNNGFNRINGIFNSFSNQFWADRLQLHMRSDHLRSQDLINVWFYSMPYFLNELPSTRPDDIIYSRINPQFSFDHHSFDQITNIDHESLPNCSEDKMRYQFSNIRHLRLTLPFNDRFSFTFPRLDRLMSLHLSIEQEEILIPLQWLISAAKNLRCVKFIRWPMSVIDRLTSSSIRQLDLMGFSVNGLPQYFNREQCQTFTQSSLGSRCEVLNIFVKERENIPSLIHNMANLRFLMVKSSDDPWSGSSEPQRIDSCVEWLRSELPSTWQITRITNSFWSRIRIDQ